MNQIFQQLKQKKCLVNQQTNHDHHQKLVSSIDSLNSSENNQGNQNEFFEIKSLILNCEGQDKKKIGQNKDQLQNNIKQRKNESMVNQNRGRKLKKQKTLKLQAIFQQYYSYLSLSYKPCIKDNFLSYTKRRNSKYLQETKNKIDLGVYNLLEIIEFCIDKKIISNQIYIEFIFQIIQNMQQNFIEKLNKKQYQLIEFYKIYFTPIDHRLLSRILTIKYPDIFSYPTHLTIDNRKKTIFYQYLYELPQSNYQQMCHALNSKFLRTWMPQNLSLFINTLEINQSNKQFHCDEESFAFQLPNRKLRKKF